MSTPNPVIMQPAQPDPIAQAAAEIQSLKARMFDQNEAAMKQLQQKAEETFAYQRILNEIAQHLGLPEGTKFVDIPGKVHELVDERAALKANPAFVLEAPASSPAFASPASNAALERIAIALEGIDARLDGWSTSGGGYLEVKTWSSEDPPKL